MIREKAKKRALEDVRTCIAGTFQGRKNLQSNYKRFLVIISQETMKFFLLHKSLAITIVS